MIATVTCPKPEELQRLLLGYLDEESAGELEAHVQTCRTCARVLRTLAAEDALVAAMRARAPVAIPPGEEPLLEELTRRLQGQRPGPAAGTRDTTATGKTHGDALAAAAATVPFDFLAPAQQADEIGRLGAYRVLKVLGRGGMGVVFLAEDVRLRRPVALKAMLPEIAARDTCRERFLRETQAAAAIEHDHIVTIHQVSEEGRVPFLVMPLLKGETLEDRLKHGGRPALAEVLRLGREIATGLAAAHARGLIHRDIKPANIWLDAGAGDRVKILDFGLARPTQDETHLTHSGVIVGTPSFMPPEQASGKAIDARADLWSLGCVLYKLCTDRLPFHGPDMMATLMQAALEPAVPPCRLNPAVPAALDDLVLRLLAKDPADRPASAQAVAEEIHQLERRLSAGKAQEPTQDLPLRPVAPRRRRGLVFAALLLLGGLLAGGIVYVQTDKGTLRIEALDDGVKVMVEQGGKLVAVVDRKSGAEVVLYSGEYTVRPADEKHVKLNRGTVRIMRGQTEVARITRVTDPSAANTRPTPIGEPPGRRVPLDKTLDDWIAQVRKLPAAEQVKAVAAKLAERNPGFDGIVNPIFEDGKVVGLALYKPDKVRDLNPIRALSRLRRLNCGTYPGPSILADLSPLREMKLTELNCAYTQVSDLAPLKGMPLTVLWCNNTNVSDLAPLEGMPLTKLNCGGSLVADLAPLKGMPLTELKCYGTQVSNLSPLEDMRLTSLDCGATPVADLAPLKGMPLTFLHCDTTKVTDWGPLREMPLKELKCVFLPDRDSAILKSMWSLEKMGTSWRDAKQPIIDFWKPFDPDHAALLQWIADTRKLPAPKQVETVKVKMKERNPDFDGQVEARYLDGQVKVFSFSSLGVTDLSPVRAFPELTGLLCSAPEKRSSALTDLSPLRGMRLTSLAIARTAVKDLTPIRWLPLAILKCDETPLDNLSPLAALPLQELHCDLEPKRAGVLRSIKTLERINGKPAAEALQELEAKKP